MTPEEFETRFGHRYRIAKITHFKKKDNLRLDVKDDPNIDTVTLYLNQHFEETPVDSLDPFLIVKESIVG